MAQCRRRNRHSSALLSWYFANFANYGATYGSLGAAIATMM
jgi:membrane protein